MIFRPRRSYLYVVKLKKLRARVQLIPTTLVQLDKTSVQVHIVCLQSFIAERDFRCLVLFRMNAQINVSVWSETLLGIHSSDGPALHQYGLYPGGAQACQNPLNAALMNGSLQSVQAICLL